MITILANLKTKERRVIEACNHPDDKDITVLTQLFLPDVMKKMIEKKLLNPALISQPVAE